MLACLFIKIGYYYAAVWNITISFTRLLIYIQNRKWEKKSQIHNIRKKIKETQLNSIRRIRVTFAAI